MSRFTDHCSLNFLQLKQISLTATEEIKQSQGQDTLIEQSPGFLKKQNLNQGETSLKCNKIFEHQLKHVNDVVSLDLCIVLYPPHTNSASSLSTF